MNAPQRTQEWFKARSGHCTASRFKDVLAKIKTGEAATRRNYRIRLVTERLTGIPVEGYQSAAMQWGTETEPLARVAYEARVGEPVIETGFIQHPSIEWCGASPDGLIGSDGVAEIKCPESHTHLEWLEGGCVPAEHIAQIQGQLWVTGRAWAEFVSFDPRFPPHLQLLVARVARDEAYIANLESEVRRFLSEVEEICNRLMQKAA